MYLSGYILWLYLSGWFGNQHGLVMNPEVSFTHRSDLEVSIWVIQTGIFQTYSHEFSLQKQTPGWIFNFTTFLHYVLRPVKCHLEWCGDILLW